MNKTSKTGVVLTVIVAVLIIGIVWFVVGTTSKEQANTLSVSTPYGDMSDQTIQNDFNRVDSHASNMDAEARDMDSFNL